MDEIISLLKDSIDMHVHAKPDLHPRMLTELEILEDAKQFEMRGVISKSHYCMNADRLQIVNNMIENIECFGGVVLNPSVGGINLSAVETAIKFGGKEIWMPSFYSEEHLNNYPAIKGQVTGFNKGIKIIDNNSLRNNFKTEIMHYAPEASCFPN